MTPDADHPLNRALRCAETLREQLRQTPLDPVTGELVDSLMEIAVALEILRPEAERFVAGTAPAVRACACGCGQPVTSPRPEARYATGACRVRAHRAR